jgi:hypothetical protein
MKLLKILFTVGILRSIYLNSFSQTEIKIVKLSHEELFTLKI